MLITGEPVSATISIALFWWSQRFIYFFFILLQFFDWLWEANLPRLREQWHLHLHFIIVEVTGNILIYEIDVLYISYINIVCPHEIRDILIFDLINVNDTQSLRMHNFANSTMGYENWYCFIIKFGVEKKWIICSNFVAGETKFLRVH